MCGIAGILKKDGSNVSRDVLLAMRDTMTHRGPDDAGIWIDGSVGLAHRRLSILDPSPAWAPTDVGSDGRCVDCL